MDGTDLLIAVAGGFTGSRENDVCVGTWLSPGDFGDSRGLFTPDWWFPNWNQYGLLKLLVINKKGTFKP